MKKGQVQQVRRWEGKGVDISLIVELNARRDGLPNFSGRKTRHLATRARDTMWPVGKCLGGSATEKGRQPDNFTPSYAITRVYQRAPSATIPVGLHASLLPANQGSPARGLPFPPATLPVSVIPTVASRKSWDLPYKPLGHAERSIPSITPAWQVEERGIYWVVCTKYANPDPLGRDLPTSDRQEIIHFNQ
ncbi:hypothetical protein An08g06040 [Aspergillus niger]|uniref:Uncharacterized protein n=2 Tax=Aspergillus niger TaxID=5061 RepID=A2QRH2_ASPNC|nr:hypothetical protein An08g06040 [Aspergillus niger]CAK45573.1 hypothetical protein An08g06040 [Aspergillus niger]